jgi:hypothetical protein
MSDIYAKALSGEHLGQTIRFRRGLVVIEGPMSDVCHFTVARMADGPRCIVRVRIDGVQPRWRDLDRFFDLTPLDIVTVEATASNERQGDD